MPSLLRIHELSKRYSGHWIVDSTVALTSVSFEVGAGETVGLLGPNGAGKTTCFKAVTGLIRPTSGTVELFGLPPRTSAARSRLGYLPEAPAFHEFLTGEEFVSLAATLHGIPRRERSRRVTETLDHVGLGAARKRRIGTYSKGMKQRVGIAQAIIARPELVILDEPMTGLDPVGRREVRDLIARLADEGTGVIFSTHVLADVELVCDRIVILAGGRVLREGRLDDLLAERSNAVELTVRGLDAETADAVVLPRGGERRATGRGGIAYRIPDAEDAEATRSALVAAGGRVVSVVPSTGTLEEIFLSEVAASKDERS